MMPRYYTADPHADADRKDRDDQKWLDSRPKCYACGEAIQEDTCYGHNGHKYHLDCKDEAADDIMQEFLEATI